MKKLTKKQLRTLKKFSDFEDQLIISFKKDPQLAKEFLIETFENYNKDKNEENIKRAISLLIKARGATKVHNETGLNRGGLYKAFSAQGNPLLSTFLTVINSMGIQLQAR